MKKLEYLKETLSNADKRGGSSKYFRKLTFRLGDEVGFKAGKKKMVGTFTRVTRCGYNFIDKENKNIFRRHLYLVDQHKDICTIRLSRNIKVKRLEMERKEYIKRLEDGTKLKFVVSISTSMWENYKVNIYVVCLKCLPGKRTWIQNEEANEEDKKHYKRLYLTEIINEL